ncbi:DUF2303 family protein [Janthinobacterium fluminis]|uniref:DUF2303 family protein n=1 Tax=Janthinobacterium fluminis TaxID=2987524 RepID=A0ABT5JU15_9BURK|nr:DUF2303 family protein [Janthinobacterium fluminis]MDC8756230.1 DUF2303 family protein [Janthinobacterium fluminis]
MKQEHIHVDSSIVESVGALTLAASAIQEENGSYHLVVPDGFTHIDITKAVQAAAEAPVRKAGTVTLSSVESFVEYVKDQGVATRCYIYADPDARTLTAVLNENEASSPEPGWRDFRAVFKLELSREFANWMGGNGKQMEQEAFAIFLEDNIADIAEPSGEVLMAVALTLQAKTEVNFSGHRRLDNGQVQLAYSEAVSASAGGDSSIEIPREFALGLRLFKQGQGYKIKARLKYRLAGGKVKFWYELDRAENAVEDAFADYVAVARESGFTVLIGKP